MLKTSDQQSTNLWRFNRVTGDWGLERSCSAHTADQWLAIFRKDEPTEQFQLSKRRPTQKP